MGALLLIARAEVRRRWPALLGLAVLIGLSGAVVLAGVGGARRAGSSVDRFLAAARLAELRVDLNLATVDAAGARALFDEVALLPGVEAVIPAQLFFVRAEEGVFGIAASPDPRLATEVNRPRVLDGRLPAAADEIALNEAAAFTLLGVGVGDRVGGATLTVEDFETLVAGTGDLALHGPQLDLDVVGIVRLPEEMSTSLAWLSAAGLAGPGFYERYIDELGGIHAAFVVASGADIAGTEARIDEALGDAEQDVINQHAEVRAATEDGVRVVVVGLAIFAGVAFLAGAVFVGQALTRQVAHIAMASTALDAIGCTRRERTIACALAVFPAVLVGVAVAGVGALAASPFVLFGLPRRAEPDPGVAADWTVLGGGLLLLVFVTSAWAYRVAWRTSRGVHGRTVRRSAVAATFTRAGLTPSAIMGARFAFEPGGAAVVPVRSTVSGTVVGFVGVVAALAFASSAARVVSTPDRWGFTWDVGPVYADTSQDFVPAARVAIDGAPGIAAAGVATDAYVELEGQVLVAFSLEPVIGDVAANMLEGRPPATAGEVALGTATMESLDVRLGDQLEVTGGPDAASAAVLVVGRAVLPDTGMTGPSGGALFTPDGLELHADSILSEGIVVRYAPGADREDIEQRLAEAGGSLDLLVDPEPPGTIANLDEARVVPWGLAGFFALLGTAGLTHAVMAAARRRRHELGVLEALGFVPGQVRAAVRWHAILTIAAGAVVGLPIGLLVGRSVWARVAHGLGVAGDLAVPLLQMVIALALSFLAAVLIAVIPGWAATRHSPAVVLRAE